MIAFYLWSVCVCVCERVDGCAGVMHMGSGQATVCIMGRSKDSFEETSSLLPPYESWELNSDCQTWCQ